MVESNMHPAADVPDRYVCPSCRRTICDPMQFPCGHRCCQTCMEDDGSGYIACSEFQGKAKQNEIFYDRAFQLDMQRSIRRIRNCPTHYDRFVTTEGISLWTITQVQSKLGESQSSTFVSAPLTLPSGYLMHLSLNIDRRSSENQSQYLSLSVNLMRGEKDALLLWPFDHQMIFSLFNHHRRTHDFLISFRPDRNSTSVQRPQSEVNDAFGISEFIPLTALRQMDSPYITDDSIFIKVLILKEPVSSNRLPILMNIDPCLPVAIQKFQIQQKSQEESNEMLVSCSSFLS